MFETLTYVNTGSLQVEKYEVDHAVKGADYIHGYDANGVLIVAFDGVADFSRFTYTGVYMEPGECLTEHCNTVRYCGGALKTLDGKVVMLTSPSDVEEWANPPMIVGVEYRTTERYMGKPVYTKLIDFGALPANATNKNVAHATAVDQVVIYLQGRLSDGVPFSAGCNMTRTSGNKRFWVDATKWNIRIYTEADMSELTAYVLVKYVKE